MARAKTDEHQLALAIEELRTEEQPELVFSTRVLTQTNLPYRNPPKSTESWERRNGDLRLIVLPGRESDGNGGVRFVGFPFGTMPRLLLAWICREALVTNSKVLELGTSLNGFVRELGFASAGSGHTKRVRDQLKRLLYAELRIEWTGNSKLREASAKFSVGSGMNVWWSPTEGGNPAELGSSIVLTEDFFKEIVEHPVPLNLKALKILAGSPMRLDMYAWFTYRLHLLDRPITVPWQVMRGHFGSNGSSDRRAAYEFKRDFTDHLEVVKEVYPEARVSIVERGVKMEPSLPHVPTRATRGLRAAQRAAASAGKPAVVRAAPVQPALDGLVMPETRRARPAAAKAAPSKTARLAPE